MRELYIAAYGLNHPQWLGVYYPEGMPEEWRLDFYANRFRALLLPEGEEPEGLEELDDDFALFREEGGEVRGVDGTVPAVSRLRGPLEPMALRRAIEALVEGEGTALLVIEGEGEAAPDIATLEAAQQIAGLLGVW